MEETSETIQAILEKLRQGSQDTPRISVIAKEGICKIREGVENFDQVVQRLQRNIIIRSNLSDKPLPTDIDAGIRPRVTVSRVSIDDLRGS